MSKVTGDSLYFNNTQHEGGNSFCPALLESFGYPTTWVCIVPDTNAETSKKCPPVNFVDRVLYPKNGNPTNISPHLWSRALVYHARLVYIEIFWTRCSHKMYNFIKDG